MARPIATTVDDLLRLLKGGEPISAGDLVARLNISRPTLMKLVADAGSRVFRIGKARSTFYAAAADMAPNHWPLYRHEADGRFTVLGKLLALDGNQYAFAAEVESPNLLRPIDAFRGHYPGLPWFIDDVRPQGFLGRAMAHRRSVELGVPADLKTWQPQHILQGVLHGGTSVGDLILGVQGAREAAKEQESPSDLVAAGERKTQYIDRAEIALAGEPLGSSPGGEQPKFTATVDDGAMRYAALVKFALLDNPIGQRWGELLVCEGHALRCLILAGFAAANPIQFCSGRYVFLEVERFDRTRNVLGRRGYVSGLALDSAFIGAGPRPWPELAADLKTLGLIDSATVLDITKLYWYGVFIGNSDMHLGNIGFHLIDAGPLALCPAFDMLPMYLAPSAQSGNIRPYGVIPLPVVPPRAGEAAAIAWASRVAQSFWRTVRDDLQLPEPLRVVAQRNMQAVADFIGDREPAAS